MVKPEVIEARPISIAEVKNILGKIHKRDGELSFRGGKTEDHVNEMSTLGVKKSQDLEKELTELDIPRFREQHILKIVDTLPENIEQLKLILSGYNVTIVKENLKKIQDIVDNYRPVK